ncbi:MAG: hypothetical protein ACSHX6_01220 [Akkermansiaceae bacterium]
MSEDQHSPESLEKEKLEKEDQPVKSDTSAAVTKLLLLLAIVFALTKWGLPLMNGMVDEFRKTQEVDNSEVKDEKLSSDDGETAQSEIAGPTDEEKLESAIENEINLWIKKSSPESSGEVKFINANNDHSRLAVEYLETKADGESESKELLFTKDEFGIYIFVDGAGVRQIRVRQPK